MKKRSKILSMIALALGVIVLIGGIWFALFLVGIEEPEANVRKIVLGSLDSPGAPVVNVTVDIYNRNSIGADLEAIYLNVFIEGKPVGVIDQEVDREIKANGETTLELELKLYDYTFPDSPTINIKTQGYASLSVFFFSFDAPVDTSENVDITEEINQRPTARIVHNAGPAAVVNQEITFEGGLSNDMDGTVERYEWDFDDGSRKERGQTVKHAFSDPGQYTVVLTVYDDDNETGKDTSLIMVIGI